MNSRGTRPREARCATNCSLGMPPYRTENCPKAAAARRKGNINRIAVVSIVFCLIVYATDGKAKLSCFNASKRQKQSLHIRRGPHKSNQSSRDRRDNSLPYGFGKAFGWFFGVALHLKRECSACAWRDLDGEAGAVDGHGPAIPLHRFNPMFGVSPALNDKFARRCLVQIDQGYSGLRAGH